MFFVTFSYCVLASVARLPERGNAHDAVSISTHHTIDRQAVHLRLHLAVGDDLDHHRITLTNHCTLNNKIKTNLKNLFITFQNKIFITFYLEHKYFPVFFVRWLLHKGSLFCNFIVAVVALELEADGRRDHQTVQQPHHRFWILID